MKKVIFLHLNPLEKYFTTPPNFDAFFCTSISYTIMLLYCLFVWYGDGLPLYMGFYQYVHWYWYHKSANIGQNWGPCPTTNLHNMELACTASRKMTHTDSKKITYYDHFATCTPTETLDLVWMMGEADNSSEYFP